MEIGCLKRPKLSDFSLVQQTSQQDDIHAAPKGGVTLLTTAPGRRLDPYHDGAWTYWQGDSWSSTVL